MACLYSSKPKPLKESGTHIGELLAWPFLKLPVPPQGDPGTGLQNQMLALPSLLSTALALGMYVYIGWFSIVNHTFMLSSLYFSSLKLFNMPVQ